MTRVYQSENTTKKHVSTKRPTMITLDADILAKNTGNVGKRNYASA